MSDRIDLAVTNFHRSFTGVSATAAAVFRKQATRYRMLLTGRALPGCMEPVSLREAFRRSSDPAAGHQYVLWHVRRNNEMRAALFARDILKLPVRIVFTSAARRRHSALPRWLISRMDAVIATTEAAASFVPNVHAVVHHGVDTDKFCPAANRSTAWEQGKYPGNFGIATIGRIRPEKGTDIFVEAMIQLLPLFPNAAALIVGLATPRQRGFRARLQQRIDAAGLSERILFTGEVNSEQLPKLVRSLSLLIASPRYEGYGITPLEAMASSVPVVATDTGFFSAFIGENEAGTLVRDLDPAQIASAARALIDNPAAMGRKSADARKRALNQFGLDAEVKGIHKVYAELWG